MKMNILLLCNLPPQAADANTISDHILSFETFSSHTVWRCSSLGDLPARLDLNRFDVLVIHYSLYLLNNYISAAAKQRIKNFKGLKILFVQDEYRQINALIAQIRFLEIDVLFSCFPESEIFRIYPEEKLPGTTKYNTLTGYVPWRLLEHVPTDINQRVIDVGYRAKKLPFWYGELAFEKWDIAAKWLKHSENTDVITDISCRDNARIYGKDWVTFLDNCKTTLGVESGASVMDFTGQLEKEIDFYQLMHPNHSFDQVQKKFLLEHEGKYRLNQISPRCFEAIAMKSVLILYEGEYSGILIADRHYIMLKKDFSNFATVCETLKDTDYLQNMADVSYREIALNPEYAYLGFIHKFDEIVRKEFQVKNKTRACSAYESEEYQRAVNAVSFKNKWIKYRLYLYKKLPSFLRLIIRGILRPEAGI